MSLSNQQFIFTKNIALLIIFASDKFKITAGEVFRPEETQRLMVEQGKSKTTDGLHLSRLAIDLNFFNHGSNRPIYLDHKPEECKKMMQEIGDFWESLHPLNSWGGNWKSFLDTPHFEMRRK